MSQAREESSSLSKQERFEVRMPASEKEYFRKAANIQGISLADFVRAACRERVERILQEQDIIKLSRRDRERFVNSLLNPPEPNAALLAAAKRYRKSELFRG